MPSRLDPLKPLDGVPASKAELRQAFTTIKQELEHGGYMRRPGGAAVERTVQDRLGDWLVAADYGGSGSDTVIGTLRSLAGERDGQRVLCAGRDTPGDGGGGLFVWTASSLRVDDGALAIRPASRAESETGRWQRVFGCSVSVLWFGAKGDAVNDDAPAITAALQSGFTVHFPDPSAFYRVRQTIKPRTTFTAVFHSRATIRAYGIGAGGSDPAPFDEVRDSRDDPTGIRMAFDLGGCESSVLIGNFDFRWRNGERPTRAPGIVAFSTNYLAGSNSQITFDKLELRGWHGTFYQPPPNLDNASGGEKFTPMFTRMTIRLFQSVDNWRGWETYANVDDIVIMNWRQKDSVLPSIVSNTALCVGYLFLSGCSGQADRRPVTVAQTLVTETVGGETRSAIQMTVNAAAHGLVGGEHITVSRAPSTARRQQVRIRRVVDTGASTSTVELDDVVDLDGTGGPVWIGRSDAAGFLVDSSQMVMQACYLEDNFGDPLGQGICFDLVGTLPLLKIGMFKTSGGEIACKAGIPIHVNAVEGVVQIDAMSLDNSIIREVTSSVRLLDGYVQVPPLKRSTGDRSARIVDIQTGWRRRYFEEALVQPVRYGDAPGAAPLPVYGHAMNWRTTRLAGDPVTAFRRYERVVQDSTGAYGWVHIIDAANNRVEFINRSLLPFATGAAAPLRGTESGASMTISAGGPAGTVFSGIAVTNLALERPWAGDDRITVRYGDRVDLLGADRRVVPEAGLKDAASEYNALAGFKSAGREAFVAETGDRVRAETGGAGGVWLYGKGSPAYRPGTPLPLWVASAAVADAFYAIRHAAASATIDVAALPVNNATLTLNGTAWTFVTTVTGVRQVLIGANRATTRDNLLAALAASTDPATAAASYAAHPTVNSSIVITHKTVGPAGNGFTLARSTTPDARITLPGTSLAGGVVGATATAPAQLLLDDATVLPLAASPSGLPAGQWAFGTADGQGFSTVYLRLPAAAATRDPGAAANQVMMARWA